MVAALLLLGSACFVDFANMNGDYVLQPTGDPGKQASVTNGFPTRFSDYPGGVDYFEVLHGPLTTVYSEVWWRTTSNPIPSDVVKRFKGKAIAIVGIETDQVRQLANGSYMPVPISASYNHHHDTAVVGTDAEMVTLPLDAGAVKAAKRGNYVRLPLQKAWLPRTKARPSSDYVEGLPTSAMFSDGNGGEYRKSMHVYSPPFAQIVQSPMALSGAPMQIDTWNRAAMNLSDPNMRFVPGPYPAHNVAPSSGSDAVYSGLLECPLTTRVEKLFDPGCDGFVGGAAAQVGVPCAHVFANASACFAAAQALPALTNATWATHTVTNGTLPHGCLLSATSSLASPRVAAAATWNAAGSATATCGVGAVEGALRGSLVELSVALDAETSLATLTLVGPSDKWFGVGFNASLMSDLPYAIIVEAAPSSSGNTAASVSERKLANHYPGTALSPSMLTVVSDVVAGGVRTLVLTRALRGATSEHYTFDPSELALPFINAVGKTGAFVSGHQDRGAERLALWPARRACASLCILPAAVFGKGSGFLKYTATGEKVGFPKDRCSAEPREDILAERNPTCDLRTYVGGLSVCHHGWKLLDADQDIPWADQPLVLYKKFRVYYQPYNASFHRNIQRHDWGIAADNDNAEYDILPCVPGTAQGNCRHTIQGTWVPIPGVATPPAAGDDNAYLILVHGHCHAPTCLKLELWNNDTGALLCRSVPAYGGAGNAWLDKAYDEEGYIATPPCLWGDPAFGLAPPPIVTGVTIQVVAVTNTTHAHHGEMALPEVSYVRGCPNASWY